MLPISTLLWMGRYSGLGLSVLAVLFALSIKNVLHGFLFTETLAAFMGIMFLGGIIWKRANRYGAAAAVIISLTVYYIVNYLTTGDLLMRLQVDTGSFWHCNAFRIFHVLACKHPYKTGREEKDRTFFDNMRRKSDARCPDLTERNRLQSLLVMTFCFLIFPGGEGRSGGKISSRVTGRTLEVLY